MRLTTPGSSHLKQTAPRSSTNGAGKKGWAEIKPLPPTSHVPEAIHRRVPRPASTENQASHCEAPWNPHANLKRACIETGMSGQSRAILRPHASAISISIGPLIIFPEHSHSHQSLIELGAWTTLNGWPLAASSARRISVAIAASSSSGFITRTPSPAANLPPISSCISDSGRWALTPYLRPLRTRL